MKLDIVGVPLDLGANRRGVDMGPSAVRYAGLKSALSRLGVHSRDWGNLDVPVPEITEVDAAVKLKHLDEINEVNRELYKRVQRSLLEQHMPLVLGGDHSIAVGTVLGVQSVLKNVGVIWMDAHGDSNDQTSTPSGNLHGMSLGACTGLGAREMTTFKDAETAFIDPTKVCLVGVREIDDGEAEILARSGVHVYTIEDIDMLGMQTVMKHAIQIASNGTNGIHLSFDMDVINPQEAPGVGTPSKGGLTYREAHLAVEMIGDSGKLRSMEFVELNPILDHRNQTGELAVSLICSAVGKRIYPKSRPAPAR